MCHRLLPSVYLSSNNAPVRCAGRDNITGLRTVCFIWSWALTLPKINDLGYYVYINTVVIFEVFSIPSYFIAILQTNN